MLLKALNDGAQTSTGTVTCASGMFSVLVTTDGTNAATVTVQRDTSGGKTVFDYSGVEAGAMLGPFSLEGTDQLYFSATGTGAAAQFFEWIE